MSCRNNIDPYNNAPPPRPGSGGCGSGGCGPKAQPPAAAQGVPENFQQMPPPPQMGRTTGMSQRPMQTPGRPDLQTENQLLYADLEMAVNYIRQIGGTWPPPGY